MKIWQTVPLAAALTVLQAQSPTVTPLPSPVTAQAPPAGAAPLYRVLIVQGSARAINYSNLKSSTKIELKGTVLAPGATGVAKVRSKDGAIRIDAKVKDLPEASSFGPEYLTYVLWGISPEGRATNLGELSLKKGKGSIEVSEALQTFGLVVTAEPYFAVSRPSDVVILENVVGKEASGQVQEVDAHYELLKRGQYTMNVAAGSPMVMDDKTPFEVHQARNAINIARAAGAKTYAEDSLGKAETCLQQAEATDAKKKDRIKMARESIQLSEDARLVSVQRQETERVAEEAKLNQARLDEAKRAAETAAAGEARAQDQAQTATSQMQAANQQVRTAEEENATLRTRLLAQLNTVLETRATARGLIVSMNGMLFQSGKATLEPGAREKLAKIAGILSTHKGLKIEAEGFTDSTGGDALNQRLSEQRAEVSRAYLVSQGVSNESIVSKGFGKANPIETNDTPEGRKANRRVELVVSGAGLTSE